MNYLLAGSPIPIAPPGGFRGWGIIGLVGKNPEDAGGIFNQFITSTIGLMSIIAVVWFIFLLITGAYSLMGAGGDKQQLEAARKKIISAIIGLVFVIVAVFIVDLFGFLLGIPNILNPAELLKIL